MVNDGAGDDRRPLASFFASLEAIEGVRSERPRFTIGPEEAS
jgi:hypothetical protein